MRKLMGLYKKNTIKFIWYQGCFDKMLFLNHDFDEPQFDTQIVQSFVESRKIGH